MQKNGFREESDENEEERVEEGEVKEESDEDFFTSNKVESPHVCFKRLRYVREFAFLCSINR